MHDRAELEHRFDPMAAAVALRAETSEGLIAMPKWVSPKWFYDARGSELFEDITALPEYYPTRAERAILEERVAEIAARTRAATLIELGSGSSQKTRLLLTALRDVGTLSGFVPFDVSEAALREAIGAIAADYQGLTITGIVGDFTRDLSDLPATSPRLVAFLGGTIGNLLPDERADFFASVRTGLSPGEWLLLGTDLVKDPTVLVQAYDDASGVTAEFNRNILVVLNRELGADFDVESFRHLALWNPDQEWIEMRLVAERSMHVVLPAIGLEIDFAPGEPLLTEISAKFTRARVEHELAAGGFELIHWWTDSESRFALSLARAV